MIHFNQSSCGSSSSSIMDSDASSDVVPTSLDYVSTDDKSYRRLWKESGIRSWSCPSDCSTTILDSVCFEFLFDEIVIRILIEFSIVIWFLSVVWINVTCRGYQFTSFDTFAKSGISIADMIFSRCLQIERSLNSISTWIQYTCCRKRDLDVSLRMIRTETRDLLRVCQIMIDTLYFRFMQHTNLRGGSFWSVFFSRLG